MSFTNISQQFLLNRTVSRSARGALPLARARRARPLLLDNFPRRLSRDILEAILFFTEKSFQIQRLALKLNLVPGTSRLTRFFYHFTDPGVPNRLEHVSNQKRDRDE